MMQGKPLVVTIPAKFKDLPRRELQNVIKRGVVSRSGCEQARIKGAYIFLLSRGAWVRYRLVVKHR
jgi:hypothetical protein